MGAVFRGMDMIRRFGIALAAMTLIATAAPAHADDMAAILKSYDTIVREQDPVRAGQRGDIEALRRWPDDSPAGVAGRKAALVKLKARLAAVPAASLSGEDALNRTLVLGRVDTALEGMAFDEERINFIKGDGFYTVPDYAALATVLHDEADAQAWLARLKALPAYYDVEIANLRRGAQTGFTQPKMTTEAAITDMAAQADTPLDKSPLLVPFSTLPKTFPAERRAALIADARSIIETQVTPARRKALAFFKADYLPKARPQIGTSSLADGQAYYAFLARRHTTTDLTPAQIHALGLGEVARIKGEMQALLTRIDFSGSVADFIAKIRADPQFYVKSGEEYREKVSAMAKRTDEELPRWFGKLPRLTYGVHPLPPGLESSSNGYLPGSPEQGIAGAVVFRGESVVTTAPLYGMPAWFLHEGVPGHHLQIALAQERTDLPAFRRNDDITAYVEGWALYSEKLGEDMGMYRSDYERFGRLSLEMWRACRLVVDTGLHAMGWTREEALKCMTENTALSPFEVGYEIDRYIAWPGQALAYKIGEMQIVELRHKAERALGPKFDIRRFHDLVLDDGPMPLSVLAGRVDAWIAAEKART
jgi:uncharacterized protein (DUF885 family)